MVRGGGGMGGVIFDHLHVNHHAKGNCLFWGAFVELTLADCSLTMKIGAANHKIWLVALNKNK